MNRTAEVSILGAMLTDNIANVTAAACLRSTDFELGYAQVFQAIKDLPKDQRDVLIETMRERAFVPGNMIHYIKILRGELPTTN